MVCSERWRLVKGEEGGPEGLDDVVRVVSASLARGDRRWLLTGEVLTTRFNLLSVGIPPKGLENSCCRTHFRYLYAQLIFPRCLKIRYQNACPVIVQVQSLSQYAIPYPVSIPPRKRRLPLACCRHIRFSSKRNFYPT